MGETAFEITSAMSGNMGLYTCTAVNKVAITELIYNLIVGGVYVCVCLYVSVSVYMCVCLYVSTCIYSMNKKSPYSSTNYMYLHVVR